MVDILKVHYSRLYTIKMLGMTPKHRPVSLILHPVLLLIVEGRQRNAVLQYIYAQEQDCSLGLVALFLDLDMGSCLFCCAFVFSGSLSISIVILNSVSFLLVELLPHS
jgi:uncharacterized membrane protein